MVALKGSKWQSYGWKKYMKCWFKHTFNWSFQHQTMKIEWQALFWYMLHSPDRQWKRKLLWKFDCDMIHTIAWFDDKIKRFSLSTRIELENLFFSCMQNGKCILIDRNLIIILAYWTRRLHVCGHIHWAKQF